MPAKREDRKDRVVVITGSTAGVGRAIARRFARAGAKLGLIARDKEALETLSGELQEVGAQTARFAADVSKPEEVLAGAEMFERTLGPVDLWINDAMVTVFSPLHEMTAEEFREVTDVTYLGAVHGTMAALKHMRPRRQGQIINIGSALAYRGIPLQSAYCGAKHAIRGFTASVRTEQEHDRTGIGISLIELPAMNTPQFDWARTHRAHQPRPMGTVYQPEVAAEAVFRAARTHPREYWVGFPTLLTIAANMVTPGFLDRYLARKGFDGQETPQRVRPDRKDNLLEPITPLHRTHGRFDAIARDKAMIVSGSRARYALAAGGALTFVLLGSALAIGLRALVHARAV